MPHKIGNLPSCIIKVFPNMQSEITSYGKTNVKEIHKISNEISLVRDRRYVIPIILDGGNEYPYQKLFFQDLNLLIKNGIFCFHDGSINYLVLINFSDTPFKLTEKTLIGTMGFNINNND